jgi:hypothetical protein
MRREIKDKRAKESERNRVEGDVIFIGRDFRIGIILRASVKTLRDMLSEPF